MRVAQVLEAVEDVHRAVFDAVLVAGDQATADAAVVGVLTGLVEQVRAGVQPLDHLFGHRAVVTEPDRAREHQDVCRQHLLIDPRPVVGGPAVLGHVRPDAGGDVVVDGAQHLDRDAVGSALSRALRSIRPWVWLRSGDRLSVQLMNSARRSPKLHGSVLVAPGCVTGLSRLLAWSLQTVSCRVHSINYVE